jgi:hypothetical protein
MTTPSRNAPHRWRFFRAGGLDQVRFETADDYRLLDTLDQKLWVALACPVKGLEFDEKTLDLIDLDRDGRIRVPEILAAVRWTNGVLKDLGNLKKGSEVLPLSEINEQTAAGKLILGSARQLLSAVGKTDADSIALSEIVDTVKAFNQLKLNGDGIVPADSTEDPPTRQLIEEIIATQGSDTDRSGKPGISQGRVETFFTQLAEFEAWARKAETEPAILPLGDATQPAYEAWNAVRAKIDDYFGRCRLAAFDPRAVAVLNRREEDYRDLATKELQFTAREVADFPLAHIEPNRPLPLDGGLNPAWAESIARLKAQAINPVLGDTRAALAEDDWVQLSSRLAPFGAWLNQQPKLPVASLGLPRIRALLASPLRKQVSDLVAQDKNLEAEASAFDDLEKLARYHRDLDRLLHNFVSFADFYNPEQGAIFQAGTLYLDARASRLCLRVDDAAKHAALAGMAKAYLAYCDCSRAPDQKRTIAVAVTDGDSDNLLVGRNGVFYDSRGRDWDATITKIIDNPISIRQAFWAPYKKLVRLIEEQVAKRAAAAETAADQRLAAAATATANAEKNKPPTPPKKMDTGTVAALGVGLGFLASAFTGLIGYATGIFKLPFWQLVLGFVGVLLLISGPSVLIAWLKLRQRNLGPILDASGWAVNGRVKIPVPLGRALTSVAKLPAGTMPSADRFAEVPLVWPKVLALVVAIGFFYSLLNYYGLIHRWTSGKWGADPVERERRERQEQLQGATNQSNTVTPPATNAAPAAAPAN